MIENVINDHKKEIKWASPVFNNGEQRVEFQLSKKLFILVGEAWEDIPEAYQPGYKTVHLNNNFKVDANGMFTEEGTGFYNWILGMSAADIGIVNGTDIVFEKIAVKIESFLTANDLW